MKMLLQGVLVRFHRSHYKALRIEGEGRAGDPLGVTVYPLALDSENLAHVHVVMSEHGSF